MLPFENATDDPDATHLCDGVAETLINTLSQLPELRVISRRSAFKFRGQHADVQEVGRKLDVQAVLVGHMVRRGDNLTINAELVDVSNNEQLWGNRYDRPLDDLLDVEQALAKDIVGGLRIRLSGEQEAQLAHRPTDDPEAYELFLKGKRLMVGTAVEMQKASEYLEQAVELDQSFALAYATLSQVYALQPRHGLENQTAAFRKARSAAETALELDSNLAEAHSAMGSVKFEFDWDWVGAEKSYKKAVALRPGNDWTYVQYSDFLVAMGRPREAIEMARRAVALDPQSVRAPHWIGIAQVILGEHDAAAAQFRHALELDPNWTWGHIKGGVALAKAGRIDEALREAAEAEADLFGADTPLARSWLGCVYAIAGEREQAEAALVRIEEFSEGLRLEGLATVCLCLGRRDEALDYMEQ
ncbi:MAG: hypothetical protein GWN29_04185, partial [Gammaproteobacteria bacterium]|nr:hypothetical protein [Gammaproteobacteria bacterium]